MENKKWKWQVDLFKDDACQMLITSSRHTDEYSKDVEVEIAKSSSDVKKVVVINLLTGRREIL